ncbi:MAG: hypothetical protein IJK21_00720 [Prevotella sp.]|nr:hypothetical protein [Prevotella sp.]
MRKLSIWMLAAMLMVCGAGIISSCGDDAEDNYFYVPEGQWLYEGQWLDYEDIEAVMLEIKGQKTPQINIYARLTTDGQWHNYPGTRHFSIEMATGTSGNIYISGDEITMGTYQLTGSSIIVTIGNSVYTFKKTEGIVVNISAAPAR